jgi:hypothetical protein
MDNSYLPESVIAVPGGIDGMFFQEFAQSSSFFLG